MSPEKLPSRGKLVGAGMVLAVVVVTGFLATDIARRTRTMRIPRVSPTLIAEAKPGTRIEPLLRVEARAAGGSYVAEVLQSSGPTDFRASGVRLEFVIDPTASFVMGAASDLKVGAVAQIRGALDGEHRLHADRVVLLTRVVRVAGRG